MKKRFSAILCMILAAILTAAAVMTCIGIADMSVLAAPEAPVESLSVDQLVRLKNPEPSADDSVVRTSALLARRLARLAANSSQMLAVCRITSGSVYVRENAGTQYPVIGKIYHNATATVLGKEYTDNGMWYHISSGSIESGYVKSEFFVTGTEAMSLIDEIATKFVVVKEDTESLVLYESPDISSRRLGTLSCADGEQRYEFEAQDGDWICVRMDTLVGYVPASNVEIVTDLKTAISNEEEAERIREAEAIINAYKEQLAREEASRAAESSRQESIRQSLLDASRDAEAQSIEDSRRASELEEQNDWANRLYGGISEPGYTPNIPETSDLRRAICLKACSYVGRLDYEWGGTSLTYGADCSGFMQQIFSLFGIYIPRNSAAQGQAGTRVASLQEARPGDIIHYDGHVGLFLGYVNGVPLFVHAPQDGEKVKVSRCDYRTICCIRNVIGD